MDVLELDVEAALRGKRRVFFLLDAHGWDVAEYVVGVVVPELFKREHVLFMHDVVLPTHYAAVYAKYFPHDPTRPTDGMEGYGGRGIWRGSEETWDRFLFLNGLAGRYPEFVALVDFVNRNGLTLHALEASVRQAIEDYPERREEMQRLLGDRMYAPFSAFAWLSLDPLDRPTQLRFPTFRRPGSSARVAEELRDDLRRNRIAGTPSPLTLARIIAKAMLGRYTERA